MNPVPAILPLLFIRSRKMKYSVQHCTKMKIISTLALSFIAWEGLAAQETGPRTDQITAMEKVADYALIPPKLNTSPLPEYDYDKLDYGMTIGIERTPGGRLWAFWVAGGDSPKSYFVLATSDDD